MWIARFFRALAQTIEGSHQDHQIECRDATHLLRHISDDLSDCKRVLSESRSQERSKDDTQLSGQDYLSLRLKEYEVLRAEQRTRLDAANRLIHYNVLVIGFVVAGVAASYRQNDDNALLNALLVLPLLSMPFTFTQWNDELMVYRIGDYLDGMRDQISAEGEDSKNKHQYWQWEKFHEKHKESPLRITAVVRSGFFPVFTLASLMLYLVKHNDSGLPMEDYKIALFLLDSFLFLLACYVAFKMLTRKRITQRWKQRNDTGTSTEA